MTLAWEQIIKQALDEGVQASSGAVPGARLRQIIARLAEAAGLTFPPDPDQPFSKFLEQYPDIALVQRRPGRDTLVVPAKNAELLIAPAADQTLILRTDLFEALTRLPIAGKPGPIYHRHADGVFWGVPDDLTSDDAVPMPVSTLEQSIQDRSGFVSHPRVPHEVRPILQQSLLDQKPLKMFSEAVRSHGLARYWHQYRVDLIIKRLRAWSQEHNIPWGQTWLQERRPGLLGGGQLDAPVLSEQEATPEFFAALAKVAREGDFARITVPLDLVIKAWSQRN